MDVAALAEAALQLYITVAGGLCQTPPVDLLQGVRPLSRTKVPFPSWEDGVVVLDLFSSVGTTLLSLLQTRTKAIRHFSSENQLRCTTGATCVLGQLTKVILQILALTCAIRNINGLGDRIL